MNIYIHTYSHNSGPKSFFCPGVCMKSTLRQELKKSATATFFLNESTCWFSSQSVKLRFLALLPARKFQEGNESRDDPTSRGPTCFWNNMRIGGRAVQSEICKYIPPPQPKDPQDCMYVFARAKINSQNPQIPLLLPSSSSERQTKYMRLPLKCNKSWAAIIN